MAEKKLPEKYLKLAADLAEVHARALAETADVDDGGTCNFDSPTLMLPRWVKAYVREAARIAGVGAFQTKTWGSTFWVICPRVPAQANRRTVCAERMSQLLNEKGYESYMYYQMD